MNCIPGQLECTAKKGPLPFQKYLLMLKKLIFGTETEGSDKKSLLCGKDINEVCMHILTRQLPQDAKYYLVEFWEKDPELREFVFRILVVVGLVSLTIFCNFCRWMTATELHYDDDYEEKTIQSNLIKKASENSNYKPSASQRISDFKQVNHNISHSLGDSSTSYPSSRREEGCQSWNVWKIMGVILAVLTILSIPWEFIRLYQKEVSKRAAQALQVSFLLWLLYINDVLSICCHSNYFEIFSKYMYSGCELKLSFGDHIDMFMIVELWGSLLLCLLFNFLVQ